MASGEGHVEVVRELLRGGASVDQADKNGGTPLYMASARGHVEVVHELLAAGADRTLAWIIDDQRKETPLEAAHRNGHHRIVQLLEEYGALA